MKSIASLGIFDIKPLGFCIPNIKELLIKGLALFSFAQFLALSSFTQEYIWYDHDYSEMDVHYSTPIESVIDSKGNVYVAGTFSGTVSISNQVLTSEGIDFYIMKYSSQGEILWVKQEGGVGTDLLSSLAIDDEDNLYITGGFQNTVSFQGTELQTSTNSMFLGKFDSNWQLQWITDAGGYFLRGLDLWVDKSGEIFLMGYYKDEVTIGNRTLPKPSSSNPFFAKFNSNGQAVWGNYAQNLGCCVPMRMTGIVSDDAGNVFATGIYFTKSQFGDSILDGPGRQSSYLVKINSEGDYVWVKTLPATGSDLAEVSALDITIDLNNNVLLGGAFKGKFNIDGFELQTSSNTNLFNGFLIRINNNGLVDLAKVFSSTDLRVHKIAVDESNNYNLTGQARWDAQFDQINLDFTSLEGFIAKINDSGTVEYAIVTDSELAAVGRSINVVEEDILIVAGGFERGKMYFDCDSVNTKGLSGFVFSVDIGKSKDTSTRELIINGPTEACIGETITLTLDDPPNTDFYHWALPKGYEPVGTGPFTLDPFIDLNISPEATNGKIYVTTQSCNTFWQSDSFAIELIPVPPKPVISISECETRLTTDGQGRFQWYLNGSPIQGATTNEFLPSFQGQYSVSVSISCETIVSDPVEVYPVTLDNIKFPNFYSNQGPTIFGSPSIQSGKLSIFSVTGALVFSTEYYNYDFSVERLTPGFYLYVLQLDCLNETIQGKFLVIN